MKNTRKALLSALACLAHSQGLGKTVTTIALMMLVPPPDVEDRFSMAKRARQKALSASAALAAGKTTEKPKAPCLPGGQLIVCPTSVLRQWARELRDKVSPTSALSVLVHHGPDRTKNPYELLKYDVVSQSPSPVRWPGVLAAQQS